MGDSWCYNLFKFEVIFTNFFAFPPISTEIHHPYPANKYMQNVSNRNIRKRCINMFKINNKDTRTMPITSFWCLLLILYWTYFTHYSTVSFVDFEQVNICWRRNISAKISNITFGYKRLRVYHCLNTTNQNDRFWYNMEYTDRMMLHNGKIDMSLFPKTIVCCFQASATPVKTKS